MSNKAYLYLIKLLSSRDYSEYKLREKMREKKFPADEIETAIKEIKDKNYLREDNYTEARIKAFMNKGYSISYIKQKLEAEHLNISLEVIKNIFTEHKETEEDQIKELILKKARNRDISDYEEKIKIIRFVISKGHQISLINKVINTLFINSPEIDY